MHKNKASMETLLPETRTADRAAAAQKIINRRTLYAAGAGLLPVHTARRHDELVALDHPEGGLRVPFSIVVRHDAGDLQHLIEHAAMLARHAHARDESRIGFQRMEQRERR